MEIIQFLTLYFIAQIISISVVYAHFHYSSIILDKVIGLKKFILLMILGVINVILGVLVPLVIINSGFCLPAPRELTNSWGRYVILLMLIGLFIPSLIIAIKKNREIEIAMKKRKETEKRNR